MPWRVEVEISDQTKGKWGTLTLWVPTVGSNIWEFWGHSWSSTVRGIWKYWLQNPNGASQQLVLSDNTSTVVATLDQLDPTVKNIAPSSTGQLLGGANFSWRFVKKEDKGAFDG